MCVVSLVFLVVCFCLCFEFVVYMEIFMLWCWVVCYNGCCYFFVNNLFLDFEIFFGLLVDVGG